MDEKKLTEALKIQGAIRLTGPCLPPALIGVSTAAIRDSTCQEA